MTETGETQEISVRVAHELSDVNGAQWDAIANPDPSVHDPFLSHAFLSALEESGSATRQTGWAPHHLLIEEDGLLRAAMPLYLKSHSQGEYVFDYGWADAFERAGGQYYPKLQCSVPFTPATGRRFLTEAGDASGLLERQLLAGAVELARMTNASSLHITFPTQGEWERLGEAGLLQRTDQQFHWYNKGYTCFDDFLADLSSRKRKNIRKERARAIEAGLEIDWVTGSDITEDHWDAFFRFYMDTGSRKWGTPYLTREFFSLIGERMADRILLVMARREGRAIAGALNFIGGDCLFGRNWGAIEHHDFLHFEACYYQAIEFAIAHNLSRVEAGAQGAHKLARGYMPTRTYSLHWIAHAGLRDAVEAFLLRERAAVDEHIEDLSDYGPYKKT